MRHPSLLLVGGLASLFLLACGGTNSSTITQGSSSGTSDPNPAPPLPVPMGTISGVLSDKATGAALAGVVVRALGSQSDTQFGIPLTGAILAEATTDAAGAYKLSGIPVERSYRVAAMPFTDAASYDLSASMVMQFTDSRLIWVQNLEANSTDQVGSASMAIPSTSPWSITLSAYHVVASATGGQEGILARRASGVAGATLTLDHLHAGDYVFQVRRTQMLNGVESASETWFKGAITAGQTLSLDNRAEGIF